MSKGQDRLLLALDFGGTKLTAGLVTDTDLAKTGDRRWRARRQVPSPPDRDAKGDLEAMMGVARDMLDGAGIPLGAVGVSFGGPVDHDNGLVLMSHHVSDWDRVPLKSLLENGLGTRVVVDNDANAGAVGEHRFGAGRGCDSLMYITISTGVGGGWILNGRPWRGAEGAAGEIGHVVVDPAGPVCACGKRGCVEGIASGPAIARRARELTEERPDQGKILRAMAGDGVPTGAKRAEITAELVARAADQGDDLALETLEFAARGLGSGIGIAANLVNPGRFVLGGGVTKAGGRWWEAVLRAARETAQRQVHFDVVPAVLGDDAPLWGAAALAADFLVAS